MDTHETKIYIAISIAAILLAIILFFFIITIIRHQRKNAQLYQQKISAEITTLEKERKRIASDLHDDLGPILSSVKLQINNLNITDEEDKRVIEKTSRYIDNILQKVRETSNNLMPNILIRKGLLVAVEEFAANINKANKLQVNTHFEALDVKNFVEHEIHLYRIIQEAINNSIKHSNATQFDIHIVCKDDFLQLVLKDNGKGFDYENTLENAHGLGLRNILSRVEMLNGEMYLDTKADRGVLYTINIPHQKFSMAGYDN